MTGTIPMKQKAVEQPDGEAKNEQVLDTLKVEKERGITVRSRLLYRYIPFPPLVLTLPDDSFPRLTSSFPKLS